MALTPGARAIFERCGSSSEEGLDKMRTASHEMFGSDERFIIGVNGSYARREVTGGSDVDLFFLSVDDDATGIKDEQIRFRDRLRGELKLKLPAADGVFENPLPIKAISSLIGGRDDTNDNITRRMLLILEGEWLFNSDLFKKIREELLGRYLRDCSDSDKICMFLLSDIIRYWRTICVDYEHKVSADRKPKAIRLIKLRFSRMMLYVAGLFAVGDTYGKPPKEKHEALVRHFMTPPVCRFADIVGEKGDSIIEIYAEFLGALDDPATREVLEQEGDDSLHSKEYQELLIRAREFKEQIYRIMIAQFKDPNPTVRAILL